MLYVGIHHVDTEWNNTGAKDTSKSHPEYSKKSFMKDKGPVLLFVNCKVKNKIKRCPSIDDMVGIGLELLREWFAQVREHIGKDKGAGRHGDHTWIHQALIEDLQDAGGKDRRNYEWGKSNYFQDHGLYLFINTKMLSQKFIHISLNINIHAYLFHAFLFLSNSPSNNKA